MAAPIGSPMAGIDIHTIISDLTADDQFWLDLNPQATAGAGAGALLGPPPQRGAAEQQQYEQRLALVGQQLQQQQTFRHPAVYAPALVAEAPPAPPAASASGAINAPPSPTEGAALRGSGELRDLLSLDLTDKVPFMWERCTAKLRCAFADDATAALDDGELSRLSVRVTCDKSLLYSEKKRQWTWHKKWTLPRFSVELLSGGAVLTGSAGLTVHVTAVVFNEDDERLDEVGLSGKTSTPYVGGMCSFQSLFFKSTSFNNKGASFHLLLGVVHRADATDAPRRLLGCWTSSPIHVDARKRTLSESAPTGVSSRGRLDEMGLDELGAAGLDCGGPFAAFAVPACGGVCGGGGGGGGAMGGAHAHAGGGLQLGGGGGSFGAGSLEYQQLVHQHQQLALQHYQQLQQPQPTRALPGGPERPEQPLAQAPGCEVGAWQQPRAAHAQPGGYAPHTGAYAASLPQPSWPANAGREPQQQPPATDARPATGGPPGAQLEARGWGATAPDSAPLDARASRALAGAHDDADCGAACVERRARGAARWQQLLDLVHDSVVQLEWLPLGRPPGADAPHPPSGAAGGAAGGAQLRVVDVLSSRAHGHARDALLGCDYLQMVHASERVLLKGVLAELGNGQHEAVRVQMRVLTRAGGADTVDAFVHVDASAPAPLGGQLLLLSARRAPSWHAAGGFHVDFIASDGGASSPSRGDNVPAGVLKDEST